MTERFFAPCPRGLESALAAELTALGATFVTPAEGGVGCAGPRELAYHANLESRIASRILWQVAHGSYRNADELYALAKGIDWGKHFTVARTLRVDLTATRSPLTSLEFATLKVKDAVCDRFRADIPVAPGPVLDDDALSQVLGDACGHNASHDVRRASGRKWHDDADVTLRPSLRGCRSTKRNNPARP